MKLGLSYDDVLIVPKYSEVQSRKDPSTRTKLTSKFYLTTPIVSACMDTVTEAKMAIAMSKAGGAGVVHRFCSIEDQRDMLDEIYEAGAFVLAAVGIGDEETLRAKTMVRSGAHVLVLDVAHAHFKNAGDQVKQLKDMGVEVIAGNVATEDGARYLAAAGADAIKVGIGPGAACSTRVVTGIGVPQFTAIERCVYAVKDFGIPIIADGGITSSGDIAKALAVGADTVMIGSLLAGAKESPMGSYTGSDGATCKTYRGMASKSAQEKRGTQGTIVPEGVSGNVPYTGPVQDTIDQLVGGLKSSMSYVGALTLEEFRKNAEFVQVTPAGQTESKPRI